MDVTHTALGRFLRGADLPYFGKLLELRERIVEWLSYIPQTFPHYTRHTLGHSEEIIAQLSNFLFDGDAPTVSLSYVEAYVLCAAAYLHDSGMVCADDEKRRILASSEWADWIGPGGGAEKRWKQIREMRGGRDGVAAEVANFLADVQVRFLVAEYVRARHHLRAADVIGQHEALLGKFAFDDPVLRRTIADICIAHGFAKKDLEDKERFPDQRDIRGEKVNVRFLATVFRLGDLLDMSCDRACPLLLNAGCPIPPDSYAHWTQYQQITHRNTSPREIEITALCRTQDEHRVLLDWCQWIVDEASNATILMAHARRHQGWVAPTAKLDGDTPSISIRPHPDATYLPSSWKFVVDQTEIIDRLIHDAYDNPIVFIRELIQNAADASRCRIYELLTSRGDSVPAWPIDIDAELRSQFPIRVEIEQRPVLNDLSGEMEPRQVIAVEDAGTGMDRDVVERFLLQIGRSYYTSPEFRRRFPFNPTSHFGIGFLSTFAVSDEIRVDTFRPVAGGGNEPLRLTLTGPRNYLLTERSSRTEQGTRVEVVMRKALQVNDVTVAVSNWCRRLEFPVIVNALDQQRTILAETPESFSCQERNVLDESRTFAIRTFPIRTETLIGEIYLFAYMAPDGERWDRYSWARYTYPNLHPLARAPELPETLICHHGIALGDRLHAGYRSAYSSRVDVRGANIYPELSRARHGHGAIGLIERELEPQLSTILSQHLATAPAASGAYSWAYKQNLMAFFAHDEFWRSEVGTVPVLFNDQIEKLSLEECVRLGRFTTVFRSRYRDGIDYQAPTRHESMAIERAARSQGVHGILENCIVGLSEFASKEIFRGCVPVEVVLHSEHIVSVRWSRTDQSKPLGYAAYGSSRPVYTIPFRGTATLGFEVHETIEAVHGPLLLNTQHAFVKWLLHLREAAATGSAGLTSEQFGRLLALLATPLRHRGYKFEEVETFLRPWRGGNGLPERLQPPVLARQDFAI